ncbi:hypothetical protein H6F86_10550 [Phormidium sp. FACHB-592]|uniref:Uncharacterized protein n=1 Tax=Stenomitos frigidus AS-A4 TaxID=2933935 RepID=A0ABV0KRF6_9CYAN|nr:hypothetical protein [Phormidium sp. FACHB-592]MBD2074317.1 hypothetical protein [Phormidium sp. FACHB-592]
MTCRDTLFPSPEAQTGKHFSKIDAVVTGRDIIVTASLPTRYSVVTRSLQALHPSFHRRYTLVTGG